MGRFHCDGLVIRDELNRQRIFRGVNVCLKEPQIKEKELKKQLLNKKQFEGFKKTGTNLIRLGVTWALLEPEKGKYNLEALNVLDEFAARCEKQGIFIMLDMHQDLFSHRFHGDGAPEWAVEYIKKAKPPFAVWAEGYFYMSSVQTAFCDFWSNAFNMQDDFFRCWEVFSEALSNRKNVIAYDYFNEPYPHENGRKLFLSFLSEVLNLAYGKRINFEKYFKNTNEHLAFIKTVAKAASIIRTPKRFDKAMDKTENISEFSDIGKSLEKYTRNFNNRYYEPFFKRACNDIGKDCLNAFEHNYYSNLGIPFYIDTRNIEENCVYSPHAYDIFVDSPLYDKYCSNSRIISIINTIRDNQLNMNVPVIFGEWGANGKGDIFENHLSCIMELFEKYQWSSTYWGFDFKNKELERVFNRPYPSAVCGNIIRINTDYEERTFELVWRQETACSVNDTVCNEIYIPDRGFVKLEGKAGENIIKINY